QTAAYWSFEWGTSAFHAHSIYLDTLATRGLAGLVAAMGVAAAATSCLWRGAAGDPADRGLVAALAGMLVAFAIAGITGAIGNAGSAVVAATLGALPSLASPQEVGRRVRAKQARSLIPALTGSVAAVLVLSLTVRQIQASRADFMAGEQAP